MLNDYIHKKEQMGTVMKNIDEVIKLKRWVCVSVSSTICLVPRCFLFLGGALRGAEGHGKDTSHYALWSLWNVPVTLRFREKKRKTSAWVRGRPTTVLSGLMSPGRSLDRLLNFLGSNHLLTNSPLQATDFWMITQLNDYWYSCDGICCITARY